MGLVRSVLVRLFCSIWLVVLRGNRRSGLGRIGPRLTKACSGARGDPPELGKLIAARGGWIQLALAGARSEQLEDHTRWAGPRQNLVFSPTVLRAGGPNKDHWSDSLGVCVCVFVAPV